MQFEESFFHGEEREGFFVEEMMKRAWAAQIEVLKVIERICGQYGLDYYAGYGTLLGAVRHKGFIPWDDDLDIFMLRDDYEAFLSAAKKELPNGYAILNNYLEKDFREVFTRIVNSTVMSFSPERMEQFHGCPYIVGVDIFPLDFLSREEADTQLQYELYRLVLDAKSQVIDGGEVEAQLLMIEALCKVKIDREAPLVHQLIIILDRLSALYHREESDEVVILHSNVNGFSGRMKKEWFHNAVWLPFECTQICVPADFHACLRAIYGESYMTPVRYDAHDYPFYKKQEEVLQAVLAKRQQ